MAASFELDAVVQSDGPTGVVDGVYFYSALSQAITDQRLGVFMVDGGSDTDPVVISATDQTRHIRGKSPEFSVLSVNLTCNVNNMTVEDLGLSGSTVTLDGLNGTLWNLALNNSSQIVLDDGSGDALVVGGKFTKSRIRLNDGGLGGVTIAWNRLISEDGANPLIDIQTGASTRSNNLIFGNTLGNVLSSDMADYLLQTTTTDRGLVYSTLLGNFNTVPQQGGYDITGDHNIIVANQFFEGQALSGNALRLTTKTGTDVESIVALNLFTGAASGTSLNVAMADADARGLLILGNQASGTTWRLGQDNVLLGNMLAAITVNFQSKAGIYVVGGDMTNATLQNIPSDLFLFGVKGQNWRGHLIPVDDLNDIGDITHRLRKLWVYEIDCAEDVLFRANFEVDGVSAFGNNISGVASASVVQVKHDFTNGGAFGVYGFISQISRSGTGATGTLSQAIRGVNSFAGSVGSAQDDVYGGYLSAEWNSAINTAKGLLGLDIDLLEESSGNVDYMRGITIGVGGNGSGRVQVQQYGVKVEDMTSKGAAAAGLDVAGFWAELQDANATPTDRWLFAATDSLGRAAGKQWGAYMVSGDLVGVLPSYASGSRPAAGALGNIIANSTVEGCIQVADGSVWNFHYRGKARTSNPSDPPDGEFDAFVHEAGGTQTFRIRYNDGGSIRTGEVSLT